MLEDISAFSERQGSLRVRVPTHRSVQMKSDDTIRSADQSETAASRQKARPARKSKQKQAAEAERLRATLGTDDMDFVRGVISEVGDLFPSDGTSDEDVIKFPTSILRGVKSRGPGEIMLAIQLAAVYSITMEFARRLRAAESTAEREIVGNIFIKLARTYATLMEVQQRCFPPP
jgi:hypothetical protein